MNLELFPNVANEYELLTTDNWQLTTDNWQLL